MSVLVNAREHEISKAFIPQSTRKRAAKKGDALPDGSFPIRNKTDLLHAKEDLGRTSPGKRVKARKLIARRQAQLDKSATKCRHGCAVKDCPKCSKLAKTYAPGAITYHTAAAREEGRKKRTSDSVARTGVATAAVGATAHHAADSVASGTKIAARHVRTGGKAAIAVGAGLAAGGAVGSAVHGRRRSQHFKAAQAGRLEREPDIAKSALGAIDDVALAPAKMANVKSTITGKSAQSATVPPAKKKPILAPVLNTGNSNVATTTPTPAITASQLTKSAFGPTI